MPQKLPIIRNQQLNQLTDSFTDEDFGGDFEVVQLIVLEVA